MERCPARLRRQAQPCELLEQVLPLFTPGKRKIPNTGTVGITLRWKAMDSLPWDIPIGDKPHACSPPSPVSPAPARAPPETAWPGPHVKPAGLRDAAASSVQGPRLWLVPASPHRQPSSRRLPWPCRTKPLQGWEVDVPAPASGFPLLHRTGLSGLFKMGPVPFTQSGQSTLSLRTALGLTTVIW